MASTVPAFSLATPEHYSARNPDPRFDQNIILPPRYDETVLTERQFHGFFLLPLPTDSIPLLKKGESPPITLKFYAQGAIIGGTTKFHATILHIQFITYRKISKKPKDAWTPFSGAEEHASGGKSLYLIVMTAALLDFPVEVLWVDFARYRESGAPVFIHPFDKETGGDALLLCSFQFPIGISPYAMLQFGDGLPPIIRRILTKEVPEASHDIDILINNLFPVTTPAIQHNMGGSRLALFSLDVLPASLVAAVREFPSQLPNWSGAPAVTGIIPHTDIIYDVGGHLPGPSIMLNPDYLTGSVATYFQLPHNVVHSEVLTLLNAYLTTLLKTSSPPPWYCHHTFSTKFGSLHQAISPLTKSFIPPPHRAQLITLEHMADGNSTHIPCVQVFLRADIAYYSHLPIAVVGGFRNHMPQRECSSPSSVVLSSHRGYPPIETLYLLDIYDCAAAIVLHTNQPQPANVPSFPPGFPNPPSHQTTCRRLR